METNRNNGKIKTGDLVENTGTMGDFGRFGIVRKGPRMESLIQGEPRQEVVTVRYASKGLLDTVRVDHLRVIEDEAEKVSVADWVQEGIHMADKKKTTRKKVTRKTATGKKGPARKKPAKKTTKAKGAQAETTPPTTAAQTPVAAKKDVVVGKDGRCVFALRLKPEERDAIHQAAGSGKASRFARAILVAAAHGDKKEVEAIMGGTF